MAKWLTRIASAILFIVGALHETRLPQFEKIIAASGMQGLAAGMFKGAQLVFGAEMLALAVIAFVASGMEKGARFVLICGATMALNAAILLWALGPVIPVDITIVLALMFLLGGSLQAKGAARGAA